jgi:predicted TIM-barrel fold metal-dependent hydrolase
MPLRRVRNQKILKRAVSPLAALALLGALGGAEAADIPMIDAHSQIDQHVDPDDIVPLLDAAGIARVILAARGKVGPETIARLARGHPNRITASVRTKGGSYRKNSLKYYERLDTQLAMAEFAAMAEVILWHAEKTGRDGAVKAPQAIVPPDDARVRTALQAAIARGWPFVIHIEFAAAGPDAVPFMAKMETMLAAHPDHPFALTHMGQLGPAAVGRLIERHPNIHFITSHTDPMTVAKSNQPWTNMFEGANLSPAWTALVIEHPSHFILGFDNVWAKHWSDRYARIASLWRRALRALPDDVAHAVAHRNAERLWRLPPLR